MIKITPVDYDDLELMFGEPGISDNIITKPFPFPLYLNGDKNFRCNNFYGHKYIADSVIDAYKEILEIFGIEFIRKHGLDNYGGCYNYRAVRGANKLSVHSWGLAVDILPDHGPLDEPPLLPYHFVDAFLKRGFKWGGYFDRYDGMHFSACNE